ncbi:thermonuclease family protein [Candidatus Saccharibacteria bacterium]|nr:thermonuclease family protein [Candidatus Saccharibacteria bacterium]
MSDKKLVSTINSSKPPSRRQLKKLSSLIVALAVGGVMIWVGKNATTQKTIITNSSGEGHRIIKVIDGDTAEIDIKGQKRTVRFIGMDTPEVVDPRKTVQCFGREASNKGHELLEGKTVQLEYDPVVGEQDKYGRLLAYIILSDGSIYNQRMIAEGYAHEYTYQSQVYKYQAQFKAAEKAAQVADLGLWSPNTCSGDTKKSAR